MGKVLTFKAPEVVGFEYRFFGSFPDANFRLDEGEGLPVDSFGLGLQKVALTFAGIKREFTLREYTHDAEMLNTIERGLQPALGVSLANWADTTLTTWSRSRCARSGTTARVAVGAAFANDFRAGIDLNGQF